MMLVRVGTILSWLTLKIFEIFFPGEHYNGFLDALAQVSRVAQHQVLTLPRSWIPLPGKPGICTEGGQAPG